MRTPPPRTNRCAPRRRQEDLQQALPGRRARCPLSLTRFETPAGPARPLRVGGQRRDRGGPPGSRLGARRRLLRHGGAGDDRRPSDRLRAPRLRYVYPTANVPPRARLAVAIPFSAGHRSPGRQLADVVGIAAAHATSGSGPQRRENDPIDCGARHPDDALHTGFAPALCVRAVLLGARAVDVARRSSMASATLTPATSSSVGAATVIRRVRRQRRGGHPGA